MKSLPLLWFGVYPGWFCLRLAILVATSLSGLGAATETPEQPAPPTPVFSVSPIDPSEISGIVPLGNLNPQGGHVFPTDHIYLDYGGKARLAVLAPAEGTVYAIRDQLHGGAKIEIRVDAHLSYYLAHVLPDPAIRVGSPLKAGQVIGRVSGESLLDLGACDARVRLRGFVNPARYPESTLHTVSPLSLFAEPLRSQLLVKVRRESPDKEGKIDYDQPGKLVGNWFQESQPVPQSRAGRPEVWARQLAFVYDAREPQAIRVSVGGTVAPAGLYAVQPGAPDPASVGTDSGRVKYLLIAASALQNLAAAPANSAPVQGVLLVQLVDEQKLKVEWFAGKAAAAVERFTEAASLYLR
jgi:hypothetical protein